MHDSRELPTQPGSVRTARDVVTEALLEVGCTPDCVEVARLLVSELATNAVRHSGCETYRLLLDVDSERARVTVADGGMLGQVEPGGSPSSEGGRGLVLVEALAEAWAVERDVGRTGTAVWFELACA